MPKHEKQELELADFSERVVAFGVDAALFTIGYFLTFRMLFPEFPIVLYPAARYWFHLWAALFLLYQAFFAADGRASIGKSLLGLSVVDGDGQRLDLNQSLLRAVLYLPSSIFGLGFVWSLLNPTRQAWHDLAVGSTVVRERAPSPAIRALVRAGACACLALVGVTYMWQNVWADRYYGIMTVAYANVGLKEISQLETAYHKLHGRYAQDIFELSSVSVDPKGFLTDSANLFDLSMDFHIDVTKTGYTVVARAHDEARTPIRFAGS